jgi:hypothetical protein
MVGHRDEGLEETAPGSDAYHRGALVHSGSGRNGLDLGLVACRFIDDAFAR